MQPHCATSTDSDMLVDVLNQLFKAAAPESPTTRTAPSVSDTKEGDGVSSLMLMPRVVVCLVLSCPSVPLSPAVRGSALLHPV